MCAKAHNVEAKLCWLSCYRILLRLAGIKLDPIVHVCVVFLAHLKVGYSFIKLRKSFLQIDAFGSRRK